MAPDAEQKIIQISFTLSDMGSIVAANFDPLLLSLASSPSTQSKIWEISIPIAAIKVNTIPPFKLIKADATPIIIPTIVTCIGVINVLTSDGDILLEIGLAKI